jgi:MFS family permease
MVGFYFKFHKLEVDHFPKTHFWYAIKNVWKNNLLNGIFVIAFVLQVFYCIMVIYTPMYLHDVIGFDWSQIGIMFTAMLSTFVFMTYPAGWLADKYFGEKEMLTIGLFITGIFTISFGLITGQNFWIFLVVLFMTRVGAALVDIMRDTYFFKRVNVKDMQVINLFRNTTSLAYIIGPLAATIILIFWSYRELYVLTGLLMIASIFFALRIKDTK